LCRRANAELFHDGGFDATDEELSHGWKVLSLIAAVKTVPFSVHIEPLCNDAGPPASYGRTEAEEYRENEKAGPEIQSVLQEHSAMARKFHGDAAAVPPLANPASSTRQQSLAAAATKE
jgi:hypothetical protein